MKYFPLKCGGVEKCSSKKQKYSSTSKFYFSGLLEQIVLISIFTANKYISSKYWLLVSVIINNLYRISHKSLLAPVLKEYEVPIPIVITKLIPDHLVTDLCSFAAVCFQSRVTFSTSVNSPIQRNPFWQKNKGNSLPTTVVLTNLECNTTLRHVGNSTTLSAGKKFCSVLPSLSPPTCIVQTQN